MEDTKLFPAKVTVEIDETISRAYIKEDLERFLDYLFRSREYTAYEYISDHEDDVLEFMMSGGVNK